MCDFNQNLNLNSLSDQRLGPSGPELGGPPLSPACLLHAAAAGEAAGGVVPAVSCKTLEAAAAEQTETAHESQSTLIFS